MILKRTLVNKYKTRTIRSQIDIEIEIFEKKSSNEIYLFVKIYFIDHLLRLRPFMDPPPVEDEGE